MAATKKKTVKKKTVKKATKEVVVEKKIKPINNLTISDKLLIT